MVFLDVNNGGPFRFYEIAMKCLGVWPLHRNQGRSMIVFSITISVEIMIVVTCLLHPLQGCLSIQSRRSQSFLVARASIGMLSQICLRVWGRSLIPLIEETIADWSTITVPKERNILKTHNRAGLFCISSVVACKISIGVVYLQYVPFIAEIIFMKKREACGSNDDIILSNVIPILIEILRIFATLVTVTVFLFFWSLAMHLCARLRILKERFQDFLLIKEKTVRRDEFRRLVESHNQLLDLSGYLENSFSVFVAIEIIRFQIGICMQTFSIATKIDNIFSVETFHEVGNLTLRVIMIYLYYYAGDYLRESSQEIGDVFAQCNWYSLSKESIKDFSIVIARCQKPCTLTCVKMYKLNLLNLRYVFNAIYSYMTCIAAVVKATQK